MGLVSEMSSSKQHQKYTIEIEFENRPMLTRSKAKSTGVVVDSTGLMAPTRKSPKTKIGINIPFFGHSSSAN